MAKYILIAIGALAVSAAVADAQTRIEQKPIQQTSAADAPQMFGTYCAVCHGAEGKGNGPAAVALKKVPADLTKISARNKGVFPEVRVRRFIQGLDEIAAHGSRDMPMWGELFRSLNPNTAEIRVAALAQYLKGLQQ